ncbi:hypothetical protein CFP56_027080 [Quercus suber]|uniref:Uncharacterized protein n=1 Tax=Quercus suber TaxID=58331 RepID=A0AAW0K0B2_QUESU
MGSFARTFRDGDKVFIVQLGSNAHGRFFMISELIHGRRKGFIVVPEGKLGSGWRGFGLHLRKAIAPESLVNKQPQPQSVLKLTVVKSKPLLLAMAAADWRDGGGSKKGKPLTPNFEFSKKSNLRNPSHDTRDLNTVTEKPMSEAKFTLEIEDCVDTVPYLSLDVSMREVRGPEGVWKVQWSKVQEVGRNVKPKKQSFKNFDKPSASFKPKPISVWRPKLKQTHASSFPSDEAHNSGFSLTSVSASSVKGSKSCEVVRVEPKLPQTDPCSSSMLAQPMKLSDNAEIEFLGTDGADIEYLGSDEIDVSATISEGEVNVQRDIKLLLQEHSGNVVKKWGNSEQWVLELRDGRRVAVLIQISLPPGEVTEVLGEQNQMALVPLRSSDSLEVSSAQFEGDEVLVEDWVSDTNSEAAELPNEGGLSPLAVEPLAFSLPFAMEGQEVVGVENPVRKESYSEWFQSRFNGFDNFLGMSLQGLENQATNFLLAVEAELHRRAALEKKHMT